MKDKQGNKITIKEFMSRWKEGIKNITPIQKLKTDIQGQFISLIGIILSIVAIIWQIDKLGWLSYGLIIIFIGNLITSGLKWISLRQQYAFLKKINEQSYEEENVNNYKEEEPKIEKLVEEIK